MSNVASSVPIRRPLSPFAVPECAACMAERCHTEEERQTYHPLSGHGYSKETGWTHPRAKLAHEVEEVAKLVAESPHMQFLKSEVERTHNIIMSANQNPASPKPTPEANHVH